VNLPGPNPLEPSYEPKPVEQTAAELVFMQRAATNLVAMHKKDGQLPEGVSEAALADVAVIADMNVLPAKAAAMAALTGLVQPEALYLMWARARNALQLLGTVALMRLADKMDNSRSPGDTRVLLKIVQWAGLPTPQEGPQSDQGRLEQMSQADVGKLSDSDLHDKLLEALKKG